MIIRSGIKEFWGEEERVLWVKRWEHTKNGGILEKNDQEPEHSKKKEGEGWRGWDFCTVGKVKSREEIGKGEKSFGERKPPTGQDPKVLVVDKGNMWRKYWQWIFVSCLSPPPPRLAMSVYSDCLDVNNKTSAQKRENGKICKRAASKNFPVQWMSETYYTNPLTHSRGTNLILGPIFFLPKPISFFCLFSHY